MSNNTIAFFLMPVFTKCNEEFNCNYKLKKVFTETSQRLINFT